MCTRKDSMLERRLLNFPGVIGVVDVGGGVAISLLLSLSLSEKNKKNTSLLLLNIYLCVCVLLLSLRLRCVCDSAIITYKFFLSFRSSIHFSLKKMHFPPMAYKRYWRRHLRP